MEVWFKNDFTGFGARTLSKDLTGFCRPGQLSLVEAGETLTELNVPIPPPPRLQTLKEPELNCL